MNAPRIFLVIVCLTSMGILCTWQHLQTQHLRYEIETLREEIRQQEETRRHHLTRIQKLKDPDRLLERVGARARTLSMSNATHDLDLSALHEVVLREEEVAVLEPSESATAEP